MSNQSLLHHCLKESRWMLLFWLVCFAWVIGYSLSFGSERDAGEPDIVFGVPAWVFWGVGVPWILATVYSCWFALMQIHDDPLEEEPAPRNTDGEMKVEP